MDNINKKRLLNEFYQYVEYEIKDHIADRLLEMITDHTIDIKMHILSELYNDKIDKYIINKIVLENNNSILNLPKDVLKSIYYNYIPTDAKSTWRHYGELGFYFTGAGLMELLSKYLDKTYPDLDPNYSTAMGYSTILLRAYATYRLTKLFMKKYILHKCTSLEGHKQYECVKHTIQNSISKLSQHKKQCKMGNNPEEIQTCNELIDKQISSYYDLFNKYDQLSMERKEQEVNYYKNNKLGN